ncbi:MAG: DUF3800 domain-containing protein [Desulfurococcales archaeon]|nr:DUF3800 domain-containing protein [Desulfurococcales archaeon]
MAKILAIDESGKPHEASRKQAFVLSGIIVDETNIYSIKRELGSVRAKYNLDPLIEFHTKQIVHGKDAFSHVRDMGERASILEDIYIILKKYVNKIVSVYYHGGIGNPVTAESRAYQYLIERGIIAFDKIRRDNEILIVIIDSMHYKHNDNIRKLLHHEIRNGIYTSSWKVSHLVLSYPLFMSSRDCQILQLADLVAYTTRRSMYPKPTIGPMNFKHYFNTYIKPKLDRCRNGRVHGCGLKSLAKN